MSVDGATVEPRIDGSPYSGAGESLIHVSLPPGTPPEAAIAVRRLVELTGILARRSAQLYAALESRIVIEQAKGVLAERYGLPVEGAFDTLRRAARSNRIKLRDLATAVVTSSRTPAAVEAELAKRQLSVAASAEPQGRIAVRPQS